MKNFMLNISKYEFCSTMKSMCEISKMYTEGGGGVLLSFFSFLSVICIHLKITLLNTSKKPVSNIKNCATLNQEPNMFWRFKFVLSFFSMAINLTLMITAGPTKMWKRKTTFRIFCVYLLIHNDTFI